MVDTTFQDIGYRLDPAVRVHRKAADGTFHRIIESKMIKEQEGIKLVRNMWENGPA